VREESLLAFISCINNWIEATSTMEPKVNKKLSPVGSESSLLIMAGGDFIGNLKTYKPLLQKFIEIRHVEKPNKEDG